MNKSSGRHPYPTEIRGSLGSLGVVCQERQDTPPQHGSGSELEGAISVTPHPRESLTAGKTRMGEPRYLIMCKCLYRVTGHNRRVIIKGLKSEKTGS